MSVETQNFGAETGQAGSAVISAITKTGGNEFHGSAFIEFQPKSFITQPYFDKKTTNRSPTTTASSSAASSAARSFRASCISTLRRKARTSFGRPRRDRLPSDFPQNLIAQTNISKGEDFKQRLYFGKLTGFVSDEDTVNLIGYLRREDNLADIAGNALESHGRRIRTEQDRYQLQWRHNAGDFLNQLNISYDKATQDTPSVEPGPELVLMNPLHPTTGPPPNFSEGIVGGGHFFEQGDTSEDLDDQE